MVVLLPCLISRAQYGPVKGISIWECISLAQFIVGELDRKVEAGEFILKLDMMKAYDRIEWIFLEKKTLRCFGFLELFVSFIGNCLNNQFISVFLNG